MLMSGIFYGSEAGQHIPQTVPLPTAPIGLERQTAASGSCDQPNQWMQQTILFARCSRKYWMNARTREPANSLSIVGFLDLIYVQEPLNTSLSPLNANLLPLGTSVMDQDPIVLAEHKTKSACENEELKLHCKESKFLNIYSATYGRLAHEKDICSTEVGHAPQFDCFSYTALEVLSKRCYGKQRCKIIVNNNHFGSPCLPGVKKYLNVSYACVPKIIFTAVDPMISNLNPSLKQNDGEYDHPERAALLFMSSVCIGLVFTLCALVIHVSCTNDFPKLHRMKDHSVLESDKADDHSDDEEEEDSLDSDLPNELTGFYRTSYSGYNSTEAAELAERIERREQIMQEIWMNSGLDMSLTRNISPFYINEQQSVYFG
ncbi:Putative protein C21orf63 like protein [Chelonia mydas]|uniref:SUEL-type lectin domain-containing protein n=1 Tax=Chelonia mydas TaxID=8469 RepID=M7ALT9_CHEMY|nr:Putative protein C21orf63 like protein [Chelonia mydas]